MKVACIGSREAPNDALIEMVKLGEALVRVGHVLASGNAPGSDRAFASGGNSVDPAKVYLYLPWGSFEHHAVHPGNQVEVVGDPWGAVSLYGQRLMARNILIVRGANVCLAYPNWKRPGGGGAGQGLRYCQKALIPVVDLSTPGGFSRATEVVR